MFFFPNVNSLGAGESILHFRGMHVRRVSSGIPIAATL